eukprot:CAMPEP_0119336488 /NCGR_PEP_ID=MMETSP1333-20130426/91949_1 /TAXON_ID=418940 /ORGANISM="Scyphosphaera apsteinii, Strain RCC1455" /LENGTH=164 /DNA_ID=CAMNT_0007347299 /DNA_START=209 /DNA_END=700 /DNA_ORIENTATION=-
MILGPNRVKHPATTRIQIVSALNRQAHLVPMRVVVEPRDAAAWVDAVPVRLLKVNPAHLQLQCAIVPPVFLDDALAARAVAAPPIELNQAGADGGVCAKALMALKHCGIVDIRSCTGAVGAQPSTAAAPSGDDRQTELQVEPQAEPQAKPQPVLQPVPQAVPQA